MTEMTEREKRMARAIIAVTEQYLHKQNDLIDSNALSAAEMTIGALAEAGLMEVVDKGRIFGRWTEAAKQFWPGL